MKNANSGEVTMETAETLEEVDFSKATLPIGTDVGGYEDPPWVPLGRKDLQLLKDALESSNQNMIVPISVSHPLKVIWYWVDAAIRYHDRGGMKGTTLKA